ncbi:MAG: hypothetical protein WCV85_05465 [Patescibacteria group bacterium]|jgi:hypothetical protein
MPSLDAITPNPKRRKQAPRVRGMAAPLSPEEMQRRRKLVFWSVGIVTGLIVFLWIVTLPSVLESQKGSSPAFGKFSEQVRNLFKFGKDDPRDSIKNINPNSPTPEQVQQLREAIFPAANTNSANVNSQTNTNAS